MKISKDRLKQIIKEELDIEVGGGYQKDIDGYEGRMAKVNLYKIKEYANKLCDIVKDDQNLEPWVQEKIAVASYIMDSVGHYIEYMHSHGGEGEASVVIGGSEPEGEEYLEPSDDMEEPEEDEEEYSDEDEEEV